LAKKCGVIFLLHLLSAGGSRYSMEKVVLRIGRAHRHGP